MNFIGRNIEAPGRALGSLRFQLLSALGHRNFTRFIILSRSRTGSNLLLSLLNSHPNVIAEWEIFAQLNGQSHREILARAYGRQPRRVRAKGFKFFYYHPLDDESGTLWTDLVADEAIRVLHLKRRNILRTLISRKIAGQQDVWASTADKAVATPPRKAVSFTVEELVKGFAETRAWEQKGDRDFRHHPLLTVAYEDLTGAPAETLAQSQAFLGLPPVALTTDMKKQNPERLTDLVTNYAELKQAFAGSEWQAFFEE